MRLAYALLLLTLPGWGANNRLASIRTDLPQISIDKSQTWRVRELELTLGDAKMYLTEGVLAFATPVAGDRVAAVFTTSQTEAGDAEVIAMPPIPAERASMARFTSSPNLDEHFTSALLYFSPDRAEDLLRQIHHHSLHPAPELAADLAVSFEAALRKGVNEIDVRISQSILDRHQASEGFLFAMMAGRSLGLIDMLLQPDQPDQLVIGRLATEADGVDPQQYFQIWSAFRARNQQDPKPSYRLTDYHIEATIHPDLTLSAAADFDYVASGNDGEVIPLLLSPRLHVTSASIDGMPASVLTHETPLLANQHGASTFLVVSDTELRSRSRYRVRVNYEGATIHLTPDGSYFVDDRNAWYPFMDAMLTTFDLTFHLPQDLRLVASGDLVREEVSSGQRTVHRRLLEPHAFAGFNLGRFSVAVFKQLPGVIEICSNPTSLPAPNLAQQTAQIVEYFSSRWMPLENHTLAVTPIEGYFGQGFPGLIYLSSMSYLSDSDRPKLLRNASLDAFFSQLLLPHEIAHQWWGNLVSPADYRSNWIVEAMSNYSALQYLEQSQGRKAIDDILADYRNDLVSPRPDGSLIDSQGPVTFGQRLQNNFGVKIWHDILYEKGTWIFHMLRERMGDAGFHNFQLRLLHDFAARPISNDDLRQEAAHFLPTGQPDRQLTSFFDTWVYDTGIPKLSLSGGRLDISKVSGSYTVDLPIECPSRPGPLWLHATEGQVFLPQSGCRLPSQSNFLFRN